MQGALAAGISAVQYRTNLFCNDECYERIILLQGL